MGIIWVYYFRNFTLNYKTTRQKLSSYISN